MNIRIALAGVAIAALTAGSLFAQDTTQSVEQQHHRTNANPAYSARHPRQMSQANGSRFARERNRQTYRADRYAYGYRGGYYADPGYYYDQAYYRGYDDSDFYGPYGQPAYPDYYDQGYQGYYPPPPSADEYSAPAAYEAPPPPDVAPVYVPARRFYWEYPGDTSPAAQASVRLHGYVNPHASVTAIPTPNNVSDQVPSHGPEYDGVPPEYPY